MSGVITFKDVVVHPVLIVTEYGWKLYFRCLYAAVMRTHETFLSLVMRD